MRTRPAAVFSLLVTGGAALAATNAVWVSGTVQTVTGEATVSATGAAVPLAGAAALVLLAGAAAVPLVTPVLARVVGVVVAVLAGIGAAAVLGVRTGGGGDLLDRASQEATGLPWTGAEPTVHLALDVALIALALGAVAGVVLVLRAGTLSAGRSRFETAARPAAADARVQAMDDWDALTRGEDPTGPDGKVSGKEES